MGYPSASRLHVHMKMFQEYGIKPGASICSLGDQTIVIKENELRLIEQFVTTYADTFDKSKYAARLDERIHVAEIYRDAGFEYTSIDLNGRGGALPIDLNMWPNPNLPETTYDIVMNYGTTEHLANQINAFAIIHYLAKPGGLFLHHIPVLHFSAHAMIVVTPYFFLRLIDSNNYEILESEFRTHELSKAISFHHMPCLEFMRGFTEAMENSTLSGISWLVLRKRGDGAYVPPLDIAADDESIREIIQTHVDYYAHTANDRQQADAVSSFNARGPKPTEKFAEGLTEREKKFKGKKYVPHDAASPQATQSPPARMQPSPELVPNIGPAFSPTMRIIAEQKPISRRFVLILAGLCVSVGISILLGVFLIIALLKPFV